MAARRTAGRIRRNASMIPLENAHQCRTLGVLVGAQILSGAGLAAGVTVEPCWPKTCSTPQVGLGCRAATPQLPWAASASSPRPSRTTSRCCSSACSSTAPVPPPTCKPRYAGADLANPDHRGRAISTVMGELSTSRGIPQTGRTVPAFDRGRHRTNHVTARACSQPHLRGPRSSPRRRLVGYADLRGCKLHLSRLRF